MSERNSSNGSALGVLGYAFVFALGALVASYAALTAWSTAYMRANPAVGSVSGGSDLVVAALFLAGVVAMFLAASRTLQQLLRKTA